MIVTKAQALDDFIERRVLGDDPFGIVIDPDYQPDDETLPQPGNVRCVYMHSVGGGCAIGKHIPEEMYSTHFESKGVSVLFGEHPQVATLFEDPASEFWRALQATHDSLAIYLARRHYVGSTAEWNSADRWTRFEDSLHEAVGLV